jgi:hypothetical protein
MNKYLVLILLIVSLSAFAQNKKNLGKYYSAKEEKEILNVMDNQVREWNAGSLEGYMSGFWKSDSLRMVSKVGIQYGWNLTLDMYKKSIKSKEQMGTLHLRAEALDFLNKNVVFVIGRWEVENKEKVGGHYTQIWKKLNGKWVITVDHTD